MCVLIWIETNIPLFWYQTFNLYLLRVDLCTDKSSCSNLGIAKQGNNLCEMYNSCAIVEDNGLMTYATLSHEIGHM